MEEDEMLETTNDAENVGTQTTEEFEEMGMTEPTETDEQVEEVEEKEVKTFTQEELDKIVKDRLSRQESKIREEYEEKYERIEMVLNAGLGTNNLDEATEKMTDFYKSQGVTIPDTKLTARQERMLANAEACEIIGEGYEEIVKATDNLARKGVDNMTQKEKLMFTKLAEERSKQEALRELASIGVGKDILEDDEFKEFSGKLNPSLSMREKYEMYEKLKPKKKIETIGSMKTGASKDKAIKEFYTIEEARKFTREDLDKNPELMKAIEASMAKWK